MNELDPTDLEGNAAAEQARRVEEAKEREREVADFKWVMADPHGRRFVWRLMKEGRVFQDLGANDALELAKQAGERRQGLRLVNEVLTVCPEQWLAMIKDQKR